MSSISDALKRAQEERERLRAAGTGTPAPQEPNSLVPPPPPMSPSPPAEETGPSLASFVLQKSETPADASATPLAKALAADPRPAPTAATPLAQALKNAPLPPPSRAPKAVEAVVEDYAAKKNLNLPHSMVVYHDRSGPIAEQYRRLRDTLMTANPKRDPQLLVVTSSLPGEGKTVTLLNLGLSLVELRANRVLLVDGCLEAGGRASLSSLLKLPAAKGLAELIVTPQPELADFLQPTPWHHLYVLPAGAKTSPAAAAEMLASAGFRSVLRLLRNNFDWVLIDTPAISVLPDASLFAAGADGVLLAAALHHTPAKKIQASVRRLKALNLPVKGAILTHA